MQIKEGPHAIHPTTPSAARDTVVVPQEHCLTPQGSAQLLKQGMDADARPVFITPVYSGTPTCWAPLLQSIKTQARTVYGIVDPYLAGHEDALTLPHMGNMALMADAVQAKQSFAPAIRKAKLNS